MPSFPTTTSYAVLGLLSVRSWTTYELAKQVQRSLKWFWPRAERKLYDEPKLLAGQGYAVATEQFTGKRRSREYAITDEGRAAPCRVAGPATRGRSVEFEGMVKVFFADAGDLDQLRGTLRPIADEAQERIEAIAAMAGGGHPFPERQHISALSLPLQLDQEIAVLRWARWALVQVEQWTDTRDPGDWDAAAQMRSVARRALDASPSRHRPGPALRVPQHPRHGVAGHQERQAHDCRDRAGEDERHLPVGTPGESGPHPGDEHAATEDALEDPLPGPL